MVFSSGVSSSGDSRWNGLRTVGKKAEQFLTPESRGAVGATAVANLANGVGLLDETHALWWRATAMVAELVQPTALLYVGLAFLNPVERSSHTSALWRARIVGCVGLLLAGFVATAIYFWRRARRYQAAEEIISKIPEGLPEIG